MELSLKREYEAYRKKVLDPVNDFARHAEVGHSRENVKQCVYLRLPDLKRFLKVLEKH